jgi:hypothetical protein
MLFSDSDSVDRRARLSELARHVLVRVVALLRELMQRLASSNGVQILALQVLDERLVPSASPSSTSRHDDGDIAQADLDAA